MFTLVYVALLSLVASAVGTLSGFGLGTIMTPLVMFVLPFSQTILLVAVIHWFHNIWRVFLFRRGITDVSWMLFIYFGIPSMVGSFLGASLIVREASQVMSLLLGFFLIGYALFLFIRPQFKIQETKMTTMIGGAMAGFSAGIFGVRGALKGAFISAFRLDKNTYIVTMALISTLVDTTRLITYWYGGIVLQQSYLYGLLIFIPASLAGSLLIPPVIARIPQERFRLVVAIFLLLAGIRFVIWPVR